MKEITREEWMTSKNTRDPTKLDDIEGASDLSISQYPSIPADAIDSFYNSQGDIRATKSDSEVALLLLIRKVKGTVQNLLE